MTVARQKRGLICPVCGSGKSRVTDTRENADGAYQRRRKCLQCEGTFATLEVYVPDEAFKEEANRRRSMSQSKRLEERRSTFGRRVSNRHRLG